MKRSILGAVACILATACATAAEQAGPSHPPADAALLQNFEVEEIRTILAGMGATSQTQHAHTGQPYVEASLGGDLIVWFIPTACRNEANFSGCEGLQMVAPLAGSIFNAQTVTGFNQRYPFATAGLWSEGRQAYISRYEISTYGYPRRNLEVSVSVLHALAGRLRQELSTTRMTVSQEGYADDYASGYMNRRTLETLGGSVDGSLGRHATAIEESLELVRVLMERPDAPYNKVRNVLQD